MRFYLTLGASALLLLACSHSPKTAQFKAPANYHQMLQEKVGAELIADSNNQRVPADDNWQLRTLKAELGDFNRVKPGKFEIYVFPKMSSINHKENASDSAVLLGKPQIAELSVLAVTGCESLIKKGSFAKYNPAKYFEAKLAENKKNKCAILEITSRNVLNLNKSLRREGDVITKRIYLDGSYNVYGIETDYYSRDAKQNEMNKKTVGMRLAAGTPSTSGLDFLPVDLPAVSQIEKVDAVKSDSVFSAGSKKTDLTFKADGTIVDKMALHQISRVNKSFKVPNCALKKISYKDHFRKNVQMYWCEGMPWPQVVDSLQFVAVTQNLSVR